MSFRTKKSKYLQEISFGKDKDIKVGTDVKINYNETTCILLLWSVCIRNPCMIDKKIKLMFQLLLVLKKNQRKSFYKKLEIKL